MKDHLSGYTWLYTCESGDPETTDEAILYWFGDFGVSWKWISEQVTHLKSEMIKAVKEELL